MNIYDAIENEDVDRVQQILRDDPNAVSRRQLINGDPDFYSPDAVYPPPLYVAAAAGNHHIAAILIEAGAEINPSNQPHSIPLHAAVLSDSPELVKLLLAQGAIVDARGHNGETPLIVSAKNQNIEASVKIVELLIGHGADIAATADNGYSAFGATQGDNPELAQYLVKHGLEPNLKDAFLAKDPELARSILRSDQDPIADYPEPGEVLDNAVTMIFALEGDVSDYNNMEPARQTVRENADIIELIFDWDVPCANSSSAVGTAAMTLSDPAVLEVLLRHGENPAMTIAENHFTGMASKHSTEVLHSNKPQESGVLRYVEDWMQQLDDPSPKVRKKAARILGRFGRNAVVAQEALTRLKDDQDEDKAVRDVAARSLDQIAAAFR